ncbi:MAG: glycosyltransferase family 2 protein [Deltaproteobacteria bacterium]|nr:glycosyltransferase family 2 protein [Deltaproteobacteria bacterium]
MSIGTEIERTTPREENPVSLSAADGLSIVIPAYNEENGIVAVLRDLLDTLDSLTLKMPVEVIVVDDGSRDGTSGAVESFLADGIQLVQHPKNRGYGAALKTGIHHARYPWILITDADGTYPNEFIPQVLAYGDHNEMVVGARIGERALIPLIRRPPKWVLRRLASYLSRREIPDLNSGFRLMRKDIVEDYFNILPDGFSFTTTITLAMFSAGHSVAYVPINYNRRQGKSKIRPIHDTLNFLRLIVRTIMYFDPLRVFIPASFSFFLASFAVAVGSFLLTDKLMDVTTVLLFVTGVQLLAIGMLADMLNRRLS